MALDLEAEGSTRPRREGRRGGRDARRQQRTAAPAVMVPPLRRQIPLYEILGADGVESIHEASLRLLEEVGIEFQSDPAAALWRDAGADVTGHRVRIPGALLMELVAKAPRQFTLHARNPARSVEIGGDWMVFAPTYGSPFVRGLDGERRYGAMEDLRNFHRLTQLSPHLHVASSITCEPVDIPIPKRHLHYVASQLLHTDKPFMGAVTAAERAADTVAMARLVFGDAFVHDNAVSISLVNCNSPLVWDATMLDALTIYAANHQAVIVSPFVLAGANTPASTAGAIVQLNAEALAGMAYAQLVRPGAPVLYGHFLATVSMKSGAPMAGTPEIAMINYAVGQLARRYGLPWRSSGMNTGSKLVDAQAAYESVQTMKAVMLAGANFVLHAAGWLEAGLVASMAKFMLDAEQLAGFYKLGQGLSFHDFEEALATIREVGPGGHYLGTAHTQANFQTAFFLPDLLDNNSFEQWLADGSLDAAARATDAAARALERYAPPDIDPAAAEALQDFIRRREAELPDSGE